MASIKDERGFNQGFKPSQALTIRTERRVDYIINQFENKQDLQILEIGCGTGEISFSVASKLNGNVFGADLSATFVKHASSMYRLPNLKFEVLDFNNPDKLYDKKFDYIIGNGILHHLYYNLDASLKNIGLLLKPNGKIIFLEPNFFNPYILLIFNIPPLRKWAKLEPDEMTFTRKFINKKLLNAGFSNIKIEFKDFLLPGVPAIAIGPSIAAGNILEKIPILKALSQSIYISAIRNS